MSFMSFVNFSQFNLHFHEFRYYLIFHNLIYVIDEFRYYLLKLNLISYDLLN
jgi:hypothetical protein